MSQPMPPLNWMSPAWPTSSMASRQMDDGLLMLMGKAAWARRRWQRAIAVELAHRGLPVHLTTSDPAAHLTETLAAKLDNLTVSRIDPACRDRALSPACAGNQGCRTRRRRPRIARRRSALHPLHGRNRRLPGVLAHHSGGGQEIRRDGYCADRAYLAPARCDRCLSPRDRASDG